MMNQLKAQLKKILPSALVSLISDTRNVEPKARWTYLLLWTSRAFRIRSTTVARLPSSIHSILVVCHGNAIRSPMAAALLRRYLADLRGVSISVSSAGTGVKSGGGVDSRALQLAREFGISLEGHQAQPLTSKLIGESDLILVMDYRNEAELLARFPEGKGKVVLLRIVSAEHDSQVAEIPDPYFGTAADIRHCFEILNSCIARLALILSKSAGEFNPSS